MSRDCLEPAATIISRFGGVDEVARITERSKTRVYRWMVPPSRGGTGGEIPAAARRKLMAYAEAHAMRVEPGLWVGQMSASSAA